MKAQTRTQIGAGVAFSPNSVRAMQACSPDIYNAFEKVCTTNQWPSKKNIWFEFSDSMDQNQAVGQEKHLFTLYNDTGANAVVSITKNTGLAEAPLRY